MERRVFHGFLIFSPFYRAAGDIVWLQSNFDLYIVNLFDTCEAAKALKKSSASLSGLLRSEYGLEVDKSYQKADWRMRPLPKDMLEYGALSVGTMPWHH